jgi:hypothetical protein
MNMQSRPHGERPDLPLRMEFLPRRPLMLGLMSGPDADKLDWVRSLPAGPPAKDGLARIVDAVGGDDDAENSYYEGCRATLGRGCTSIGCG